MSLKHDSHVKQHSRVEQGFPVEPDSSMVHGSPVVQSIGMQNLAQSLGLQKLTVTSGFGAPGVGIFRNAVVGQATDGQVDGCAVDGREVDVDKSVGTHPTDDKVTGSQVAAMPILVLNVHSRCNCRCVMCDIWKREGSSEIKLSELEPHRASLRRLSVRRVVLSGGEPLLHSDLQGLCSFFRQENIGLTLLTTGLLLIKRAAEIANLFDDVIVSLDGPEAIHDSIRRISGAYRLIRDGVTAIRRLRPSLPITGRSTIQKANHLYLRETVSGARTIGLDSISFLAADLTSEAFNRPLLWPEERQSQVALTLAEVSALEIEMEHLIASQPADIEAGYIVESASKLRGIIRHFRAHLGIGEHQSPPCNAPWVSAVIETDGSVRPCFFHRPIGNIHQAPLHEVINGASAVSFRRALNVAENPICRQCVCSLNYREQEKIEGSSRSQS